MGHAQFHEVVHSCTHAAGSACSALGQSQELAAVLRGYAGIAGDGEVPVVHLIYHCIGK